MYIIFGSEHVATLKERHTVLELETIYVDNEPLVLWCVLAADDIPLAEMSELERLERLHGHLITNYNIKNYPQCIDTLPHLKGKWGEGMDSFYEIIEQKISDSLQKSQVPDQADQTPDHTP